VILVTYLWNIHCVSHVYVYFNDTLRAERMTHDTRSNRIDTVIIHPRYNGPSTSGNGGWVAGSLARLFGKDSVSVTLRAPAPLAVPMFVRWRDDGTATLDDSGTLIAEAALAPMELDVPKAPGLDEVDAAGTLAQRVSAQRGANWPYATCFGCGFARRDGLRIVPGPVGDDGIVATTWTPPSFVADAAGQLSVEATWAALDCSGGIAWIHRLGAGTVIFTARMTASIDQPLQVGHRYTVIGWPIARDGRKLHAGTAIFDAAGKVQALSSQLWLIPRA